MKNLITFQILILSIFIFSQVGIGTNLPHKSTSLDIVANNKGLLLNRIELLKPLDNTTIKNTSKGMMVYSERDNNLNTSNEILGDEIYYYNDTKWVKLIKPDEISETLVKLKAPVLGMYALRNADLTLMSGNSIINQAFDVNESFSDTYINTNVMQRVNNTDFKILLKGVYMIDGYLNIVQNSTDISWSIKVLVSTDGGNNFAPLNYKGNYCNHYSTAGVSQPITCIFNESLILNPNNIIRISIQKFGGTVNTSARLDAAATRKAGGFKILCYPQL